MKLKYACEFRMFGGSTFTFYAENERALTECMMFARDDVRVVSWMFIKIDEGNDDE